MNRNFLKILILCFNFLFINKNLIAQPANADDGNALQTHQDSIEGLENTENEDTASGKSIELTMPAIISYDETIYPISVFDKDTTLKFVAAYGKDSLVSWVNKRINKAVKYFNTNASGMQDEWRIAELLLISKEFNLGIDTLDFSNLKLDKSLLKLYNRTLCDASVFFDTIKAKSMTEKEVEKLFQTLLHNRIARNSIAAFGDYFNFRQITIDSIYEISRSVSSEEKIDIYFLFSEFARNNPAKKEMVEKYRTSLFKYLYNENNLDYLINNYIKNNTQSILIDPMRLLSFSLYAKELSYTTNHLELMYLLALQNYDGGWKINFTIYDKSDAYVSIYGLWALCEFKKNLEAQ